MQAQQQEAATAVSMTLHSGAIAQLQQQVAQLVAQLAQRGQAVKGARRLGNPTTQLCTALISGGREAQVTSRLLIGPCACVRLPSRRAAGGAGGAAGALPAGAEGVQGRGVQGGERGPRSGTGAAQLRAAAPQGGSAPARCGLPAAEHLAQRRRAL